MKKGVFIVIGVLTAVIITVGGLLLRDNHNTEKQDEALFTAAAKTVAYEIGEYIDTGDEDYFGMAAEDVARMGAMSVPGILSEGERAEIFERTVNAFSQKKSRLTAEAKRLSEAFGLLADDPLDQYPYTQLKIALDNCGIE